MIFVVKEYGQKALGALNVTYASDPDYPGVDIEFLQENENPNSKSRPRVLIEFVKETRELRLLVWNNPNAEDYSEEITLAKL